MPIIKNQFLKNCGLQSAKLVKMPQDASTKTFDRVLSSGSDSLILMHYPQESDDFDKFIIVSKVLIQNSLLAPKVLACDKKNSLVLLQDFGDLSVKKYLQTNFVDKILVYQKIIAAMAQMQNIEAKMLGNYYKQYCSETLLNELKITTNWYFQYAGVKNSIIEQFFTIWQKKLQELPSFKEVFVHRDFHVENLFIVDNQIGIIDFQDCVFGSPIYDLVSLLDDARFDVTDELRTNCINYYLELNTLEAKAKDVLLAYHILGAQRNSRILGVFARKALQGDSKYVHLIPRVIGYLKNNLLSPELCDLADFYHENNILVTTSA
jgi:aminoglycoside/choline kinase family phosphotransferase